MAEALVRPGTLGAPIAWSVLLHAGLVGAALLVRAPEPAPQPPTYRVNLVAAPPGPRAAGVVRPPDPVEAPKPAAKTPPRPVTERPPEPTAPTKKAAPVTRTPPKRSTPTPAQGTKAPPKVDDAPRAGGGPEGGRGTDVANVNTAGINFPFPGYLDNIVRQITLRFQPPRGGALRADVAFLIRRDGTVTNIRFVQSSGNYSFDVEARGAVEKAAREKAFGPLPAGFSDDALPVIFSFDPRIMR